MVEKEEGGWEEEEACLLSPSPEEEKEGGGGRRWVGDSVSSGALTWWGRRWDETSGTRSGI